MQQPRENWIPRFDPTPALEPDSAGRATLIRLLDLRSAPMRAFHLSWIAFFVSFVAWFGIAPLMAIVRDDLKLTKAQIGNTVSASVAITIFARLLTGWMCDRFGPRRTYSVLLLFGALPVTGIGLAHSYESFLLFRLAIGLVGASFVITQYHTSVMFSRSVVGTANAMTAGWGNLGGGIAQWIVPLLFGAIVGLGCLERPFRFPSPSPCSYLPIRFPKRDEPSCSSAITTAMTGGEEQSRRLSDTGQPAVSFFETTF